MRQGTGKQTMVKEGYGGLWGLQRFLWFHRSDIWAQLSLHKSTSLQIWAYAAEGQCIDLKKKVEGALWGPRMPELQVLHQLHQISSATFMYCYWKYGIRRKSQQNVGMPSLSPYLRKGTEQTVAFPSCPQLGTFWLGSWLTDSSPYQRKFFQNLRVDFALIGEP